MSKKTFAAAPKPKQPTDEQIAAFEAKGAGHDLKPVNVVKHKSGNVGSDQSEPTKRLSLDLPISTHTRFKTACSATGTKMVKEVEAFIQQRTAELEEEAGLTRK